MNIFVLSTGRCGSTTLAQASQHIQGMSAAHESQRGEWKRSYPDNHIESDPSLQRLLGWLGREYPGAFYVHLERRREAVVRSFFDRAATFPQAHGELVGLWNRDAHSIPTEVAIRKLTRHYHKTVNQNISYF